jgi:hypothetical protein
MINSELVDAVRAAMHSPENLTEGGRVNWDFVEADVYLDFLDTHDKEDIDDSLNFVADNYEVDNYDEVDVWTMILNEVAPF